MDDNGSIVLEMCLITPILVCAVFVVMNMLFIAFNHAAASGKAYLVLYNREEYRINESGEGDTDSAEKAMSTNVSETVICADGVNAEMAMNGKDLVAEITYRESFPGIQILIDDGRCDRKTAARQEIRDVGNELRRWQEYGKLLPGRGN